jgi:hypothetical protein
MESKTKLETALDELLAGKCTDEIVGLDGLPAANEVPVRTGDECRTDPPSRLGQTRAGGTRQ